MPHLDGRTFAKCFLCSVFRRRYFRCYEVPVTVLVPLTQTSVDEAVSPNMLILLPFLFAGKKPPRLRACNVVDPMVELLANIGGGGSSVSDCSYCRGA